VVAVSLKNGGVRFQDLVGIFWLSFAILAFELTFNKIVQVQHFGTLGYVVIGTALFGFALAGVLLAVNERLRAIPSDKLVPWSSLLCGISMPVAYLISTVVPLDFTSFFTSPVLTCIHLALCYIGLTLPFFFGGLAVVSLLGREERGVSWLYASDLVGAGLGAAVVLPLLAHLGGAGAVSMAGVLAALSGSIFALRRRPGLARGAAVATVAVAVFGFFAQTQIGVVVHTKKRGYIQDRDDGRIVKTKWTALTRVDVAESTLYGGSTAVEEGRLGMIWFDAGTMQSNIFRIDKGDEFKKHPYVTASSGNLPYRLRPRKNVLAIASSGGREVLWALSNETERVTAVELDPAVCDLVKGELDEYLGGLFNRPEVTLYNDEGRSFVKRSKEKYDVIQQVSAYSITAVSTGASAAMDSYLVTVEAMEDYWERLTDDGVISISREHGVKLFVTALAALEKMGVDPTGRICLTRSFATYNHNHLLVRKTPFPRAELEILADHVKKEKLEVFYAPDELYAMLGAGFKPEEPDPAARALCKKLISLPAEERVELLESLPFDVEIPTDDKPFFNRMNHYMTPVKVDESTPGEFVKIAESQRKFGPVPLGDIPQLAVLIAAALLAGFVILWPLRRLKGEKGGPGSRLLMLVYFSMLGIGFIALEVILLQRYILFVGSPMLSMAIVLGGLLVAAGVGSGVISPLVVNRRGLAIAVFAGIVVLTYLYATQLESIFRSALHLSLLWRCVLGVIILIPIGLLLGVPFPVGLRYAHRQDRRVVAWGWALNGYMTVVGTTAMSITIQFIGYTAMFLCGGLIYLIAALCFLGISRARG
jgi:spermidine synthase